MLNFRRYWKKFRCYLLYFFVILIIFTIYSLLNKDSEHSIFNSFSPLPVINPSEFFIIHGTRNALGQAKPIYIINLPSRADRRLDTIGLFQRLNLQAFLVPAYSINSVEVLLRDRFRSLNWFFTRTELACWASHMRLWITIASSKPRSDWTLIFEDDIDLELDIVKMIDSFPQFIWKDADLIYLGHCDNPPGQLIYQSNIFSYRIHRARNPSCTHAYAIRSTIIDQLVVLMSRPTESIDNSLVKLVRKNQWSVFSIHPPLALQKVVTRENPSNINQIDRQSLLYRLKFFFYSMIQWWNGVEPDQPLHQSTLEQINRTQANQWRIQHEKGLWLSPS